MSSIIVFLDDATDATNVPAVPANATDVTNTKATSGQDTRKPTILIVDGPVLTHPHEYIHFEQPDNDFYDDICSNWTIHNDKVLLPRQHVGYLVPDHHTGACAALLARIMLAANCAHYVEHLASREPIDPSTIRTHTWNDYDGPKSFDLTFEPFSNLINRLAARFDNICKENPDVARILANSNRSTLALICLSQLTGGDTDMDNPFTSLTQIAEMVQWTDSTFNSAKTD